MRVRLFVVIFVFSSFLMARVAAGRPQGGGTADTGVAARRAVHLRHGINLNNWFGELSDSSRYTKERFEGAITTQDLKLIHDMGFDYVRLCLDPQPMFHHNRADQLSAEDLNYLDTAVKMILDQGLAVDIDIHPSGDFKQKLATQDDFVEEFADYWRALARHFSNIDPERVYFEILNEPEARDRYRWYGVEAKLVAAIREGAPQQTIIAPGARWDDNDDLLFVEPLRDPNVIYTFHFYEAHIFTHQGATWGANYWHNLSAIPYPSTPENVQRAAAQVGDPVHRLEIMRYGTNRWDAKRIDVEVEQVANWAKQRNVTVICNEFGVYRKVADPNDRVAWLTDVRTALEKYGIGWAMWDYGGGFAVVNKQNGQSVPDELTVRALGRTMPTAH